MLAGEKLRLDAQRGGELVRAVDLGVAPSAELAPVVDGTDPAASAGLLRSVLLALQTLSVPVILAAQTAGGAIGSMLAPAKIVVGCSTVGLGGKEGPILRAGVKYGLAISAAIGVVAFAFSRLG